MKIITTIFSALIFMSFLTIQFSEKDLIGKWKIHKIENSSGSIDSITFRGQTFSYKSDYTAIHLNPQSPFEKEQTGKWEMSNDTLYQFNPGEKKVPFKILILNNQELVVVQQFKDTKATIFYKKIKK